MKLLVTTIISVAALGLLVFTNPKMTEYEQFIRQQIINETEKADNINKTLGFLFSGFSSGLITNVTQRTDYVFLSIYDSYLGNDRIKVMGVLSNFFVIKDASSKQDNPDQAPVSTNRQTALPTGMAENTSSQVDFFPATTNQWQSINIDAFGWQQSWSVIRKSEQPRFMRLLGNDYVDFIKFIEVSGWVKRSSDFLVGEGCMAHDCNFKHGIFIIDGKTGRSYAASIDGNRIKVWGSGKPQDIDDFEDLPYPLFEWMGANGVKMDFKID